MSSPGELDCSADNLCSSHSRQICRGARPGVCTGQSDPHNDDDEDDDDGDDDGDDDDDDDDDNDDEEDEDDETNLSRKTGHRLWALALVFNELKNLSPPKLSHISG